MSQGRFMPRARAQRTSRLKSGENRRRVSRRVPADAVRDSSNIKAKWGEIRIACSSFCPVLRYYRLRRIARGFALMQRCSRLCNAFTSAMKPIPPKEWYDTWANCCSYFSILSTIVCFYVRFFSFTCAFVAPPARCGKPVARHTCRTVRRSQIHPVTMGIADLDAEIA